MPTPESKVKAKVKKVLTDKGAYYFFPMSGGYGNSGVPDIVACIRGVFFGIECKAQGNQPTALQLKHINDIIKAGGVGMVVNEESVGFLAEKIDFHLQQAQRRKYETVEEVQAEQAEQAE